MALKRLLKNTKHKNQILFQIYAFGLAGSSKRSALFYQIILPNSNVLHHFEFHHNQNSTVLFPISSEFQLKTAQCKTQSSLTQSTQRPCQHQTLLLTSRPQKKSGEFETTAFPALEDVSDCLVASELLLCRATCKQQEQERASHLFLSLQHNHVKTLFPSHISMSGLQSPNTERESNRRAEKPNETPKPQIQPEQRRKESTLQTRRPKQENATQSPSSSHENSFLAPCAESVALRSTS